MVFDNGAYRNETPEELKELKKIEAEQRIKTLRQQIADRKEQLRATDYQAIKKSEGWISEADYAPIRAERQAIRDEINQLESRERIAVAALVKSK